MRQAIEAEILWIYGHSARRGLAEPFLPDGTEQAVRGRGRTVAALGKLLLAEGGDGFSEPRTAPGNPFERRCPQVSSEWGNSYQALLALSEMPQVFALPGAASLQQLDDLAYLVGWTARLVITPGAKAEAKTRKRARHLKAQAAEYVGAPAGPPASALSSDFGSTDYTFSRPVGEQTNLWHAMLPGCRTPRVMTGYAQYLLARDFAMTMPWCGSQLRDERGGLFGLQLASGGARSVMADPSRDPRENASATLAFIGELGAGTSVGLKSAVYHVSPAATGKPNSRGRAVIVNRIKEEEWARFAKACPGTTQVICIDQSSVLARRERAVAEGWRDEIDGLDLTLIFVRS
ncbi:ATP-binding protein [Streptomyces sp. NBC_01669]|uniref:ATP-binding protein n=1 Tax=Streptomyces sp. NBC_01669 TaxID=2975909 RepID=UPI00224E7840|nr:ATP-binding protein [Streptomyces sp. NBC_01669]MCX4538561.1 ATP-binding protein [Streptomyces sp. NBC_01669]